MNLCLAVAFLTTRVSKSTEQDWRKLRRLLQCFHRSIDMLRTISENNLSMFKTWVDAAYGVHLNMKSHTGGCLSFGTGVMIAKSSKQKLNAKSSTESEVVGSSDYLTWIIWVAKFMKY